MEELSDPIMLKGKHKGRKWIFVLRYFPSSIMPSCSQYQCQSTFFGNASFYHRNQFLCMKMEDRREKFQLMYRNFLFTLT